MNEVIQEFCDSRDVRVRVDREEGVLRGVKILGLSSRNGRQYLEGALQGAIALYDGAKVNVNHPKGSPLSPRDYQDRIGMIRNVSLRKESGLYGDLHFNPRHALAEQLIWDAEHATENVGFSHNVLAHTARRDGDTIVEKITQVTSVDLVADPATTRGLFESREGGNADLNAVGDPSGLESQFKDLSCDQLRETRPDLVEELLTERLEEINDLRQELERLRAVESTERRRHTAITMIREHGLPDPFSSDPVVQGISGPAFLESLLSTADESEMNNLVEERAQLVRDAKEWQRSLDSKKPVSRDQNSIDGHLSHGSNHTIDGGVQFAKAIRGSSSL